MRVKFPQHQSLIRMFIIPTEYVVSYAMTGEVRLAPTLESEAESMRLKRACTVHLAGCIIPILLAGLKFRVFGAVRRPTFRCLVLVWDQV